MNGKMAFRLRYKNSLIGINANLGTYKIVGSLIVPQQLKNSTAEFCKFRKLLYFCNTTD